jgi:hypothetical protein
MPISCGIGIGAISIFRSLPTAQLWVLDPVNALPQIKAFASALASDALTVDMLYVKDKMSRASVDWEQTIGELGLRANAAETANYRVLADQILAALDPAGREG